LTEIQLIEAPATTAWITAATARPRLGTAAADDATLQQILDELSDLAETAIIGRPIQRAKWREKIPSYGGHFLQLSRGPVEPDTLTLALDDIAVDVDDFTVESAAAKIHSVNNGRFFLTAPLVGRSEQVPAAGLIEARYEAIYFAGYYCGSANPPPTGSYPLPPRLRGALIEMARLNPWVSGKNPGWSSVRKADREIRFVGDVAMPASALLVLEQERDRL
jgi:hypothetical protein